MRTNRSGRSWVALAGLAIACGGDAPGTSAPIGNDDTAGAAVVPEGVAVEVVTGMPTALRVTWTTAEPVAGHVAVQVGARTVTTQPSSPTTEHAHLVVGLPPDTDLDVVAVAGAAETGSAAPVAARTGALPGVPTFTVEGSNDRYMVLPLVEDDVNHIVVIDPEGRVVWHHRDERALAVFRAHVARDGSGVMYTATLKGGEPNPDSLLIHVPWDGGPEETTAVPYLAHDFVELDDGAIVSLAYEYREEIQGNKLVRIEPDGTSSTLWSAWDCFDPELHPSIDLEHGWTHANALDEGPDGSWYVNFRNLTSLVRVEADGACNWGFGGAAGTVAVDGPTFYHQHQFEVLDDGLLIFDNDGAPGNESRVIEYGFDGDDQTASLRRVIQADPPLYSFILGDVHRVDDDTLITWSVPNIIDRVDPDGARTFRLVADNSDLIFGFTELMLDPNRPDLGIQH